MHDLIDLSYTVLDSTYELRKMFIHKGEPTFILLGGIWSNNDRGALYAHTPSILDRGVLRVCTGSNIDRGALRTYPRIMTAAAP